MQHPFYLPVHAPELIGSPFLDRLHCVGIDAQGEWLFYRHRYWFKVPVLITGFVSLSPHSTTIKLLTMVALRSSSNSMIFLSASICSALSTMPTAPSTILWRAATTAEACCLRSIECAISGA